MEQKQTYFVSMTHENKSGDIAIAEYYIDINSYLEDNPIIVSFAPANIDNTKQPVVIKIPANFMKQLCTIPEEVQKVPIEFLIKLAHKIKGDEGKSILDITNEKKIDIPQKKLII